jgi:hypothetical protein
VNITSINIRPWKFVERVQFIQGHLCVVYTEISGSTKEKFTVVSHGLSISILSPELQLTNFMELSPSCEAASCAATQELPSILWNPKGDFCVHKSLPPEPIMSQINPVIPPHYISIRSILILSIHLRLGLPNGVFPSGFPTNILYAFHFSPNSTTCSAYLILFDLININ